MNKVKHSLETITLSYPPNMLAINEHLSKFNTDKISFEGELTVNGNIYTLEFFVLANDVKTITMWLLTR